MKGFATFFTSRGRKEKDASLSASASASSANNNNNTKVPAIKVNDAYLHPPQRDAHRAPSPSPSSLSSAFSKLHRPSLASLRKHMSSDAQTTLSSSSSSASSTRQNQNHLQPNHQPSSRLALSRSFFRSVSDVSKSAFTSSSTTESIPTTPSSAMSSTSTVHLLTVGRKPSNASLMTDVIDGSALHENGKARHEALPRAVTPSSQLDLPHQNQPHCTKSRLLVPRASSPHLAPPTSESTSSASASSSSPNAINVSSSSNFDVYDDPFAAHYCPPARNQQRISPPLTTTTTRLKPTSSPDSPPQRKPIHLPKASAAGPVGGPKPAIQPRSTARPRALSLGSAGQPPPPCPAHVLGPLPPLPLFARHHSTLPGVEEVPSSAPAHALAFSPAMLGRDRSGSGSGANVKRRPSTGGSMTTTGLGLGVKRPVTSPRPSTAESVRGASESGPATWSAPTRPTKRVPQLDQTWAQFLSETEPDLSKMVTSPSTSSASTITAGTGCSSVRSAITARIGGSLGSRMEYQGGSPRGPPPDRPLPPAPVQPLNIRRRARAQTVGTTSPVLPQPQSQTTASLLSLTATVSQPVVGLGVGVGGFPMSPPPTAGPKLDFDRSVLDVVVTPATDVVDVVEDDSKTASRPNTPATVSSLPYLRGSESTNNMLSAGPGRHSRNSSLSGSEWDGCSRTVSEMSLSLFPAPPSVESPVVAPSSSLLPPPSSLSAVLELPTPPVTPTNPRFVPTAPAPAPGLYAASVASRSTSTIRPSRSPEEETAATRDSCVLPLEDRSQISSSSSTTTPTPRPSSEVTTRYSADSSRGFGSTVSSHTSVSVEDSVCRTSLDTDQTSEMMHFVGDSPPRSQKRRTGGVGAAASGKSKAVWCPPSPPQADLHSTQGKDKFNLLPNFYFDATFAGPTAPATATSALQQQPPSTPIRNGKVGVKRREQLLNLLSANESAAQLRSPGSPWGGRVEWGEAL